MKTNRIAHIVVELMDNPAETNDIRIDLRTSLVQMIDHSQLFKQNIYAISMRIFILTYI